MAESPERICSSTTSLHALLTSPLNKKKRLNCQYLSISAIIYMNTMKLLYNKHHALPSHLCWACKLDALESNWQRGCQFKLVIPAIYGLSSGLHEVTCYQELLSTRPGQNIEICWAAERLHTAKTTSIVGFLTTMISSQQKHLRPLKTNIPPENWSLEN